MWPTVRKVFYPIRNRATLVVPWLVNVKIQRCSHADSDNKVIERAFMHVGHRRWTVCYAGAVNAETLPWKIGLIVHELGHLVVVGPVWKGKRHTEGDANEVGSLITGLKTTFEEWIGPSGASYVLEWAKPSAWLRRALDA